MIDKPKRRYPLRREHRSKPDERSPRARNWRRFEVGDRIVDKYDRITDWELLDEPYTTEKGEILCLVDVKCLACGRLYTRTLNCLVQGRSQRCIDCWRCQRRAPQPEGQGGEGA